MFPTGLESCDVWLSRASAPPNPRLLKTSTCWIRTLTNCVSVSSVSSANRNKGIVVEVSLLVSKASWPESFGDQRALGWFVKIMG